MCHAVCEIGAQPLVDGLGQIRAFLDRNRAEVVSIIFESYVSAADTERAFARAGLSHYLAPHAVVGAAWPTLRELIERDQRLVVFTDHEGGTYPWYLDEFTFCWENPYQNTTPSDFRCTANRGVQSNDLFVLNHFLEAAIPTLANAELVNFNPGFIDHARTCMLETGRLPNFPTVDFYEIGDLFAVARELNGL